MKDVADHKFKDLLINSKSWHDLSNKVFGYSSGITDTLNKTRAKRLGMDVRHLNVSRRTKICEKCNSPFFPSVKIEGKRRNLYKRRYCFSCSPFGKHNTRNLNGALTNRNKYSQQDIDIVKDLYNSGMHVRQISRKVKIGTSTIGKWMKKGYIKARSYSEAMKLAARYRTPPSEKTKKKMSISRKKLLKDKPELHPNRLLAGNRSKMSFPEKLAFDFLKKEKIEFIHNALIGKYFVDFLIGDVAIEVDGERWHDAKKDSIRDKEISLHGVKIFRFKAKDVVKDVSIINIFKTGHEEDGNPRSLGLRDTRIVTVMPDHLHTQPAA